MYIKDEINMQDAITNYYETLALDRYELMDLSDADVASTVKAAVRQLILDTPTGTTVEEMKANRDLEKEYERIATILSDPIERARYDCALITHQARTSNIPVTVKSSKTIPGLAQPELDEVDAAANRIAVSRETKDLDVAAVLQGEVADASRRIQQGVIGAGVKAHRIISDILGL